MAYFVFKSQQSEGDSISYTDNFPEIGFRFKELRGEEVDDGDSTQLLENLLNDVHKESAGRILRQ